VFPGYQVAEIFVLIKTVSLQADRQDNVQNSKRIDQCMKSVGQRHILWYTNHYGPFGIEKYFGIREAFFS
jgi:hypothetical protein